MLLENYQKELITKYLGEIFPGENIKGKDQGNCISFNRKELNHSEIVGLSDLGILADTEFKIKRSGTGLCVIISTIGKTNHSI